jgi:hypothetical protein
VDLVEDDVPLDGDDAEDEGDANFDPHALEAAVRGLYTGAKSSTLAATILLLNLCTIHGVSNCFVDELFSILHGHILPEGNSLPRNYYAAKTMTKKLGLGYNTIHACESGCVLFRGEHANGMWQAREPGAGSGEGGAGKKRAGSREKESGEQGLS